MIFFGERMLRRALAEYVGCHYHTERNHQGLDNAIIRPAVEPMPTIGPVLHHKRLGGLLSYYHRTKRAG